jgi:beta-ureidopropionase / N-carbamoyl-L-amino-acid hydrolase
MKKEPMKINTQRLLENIDRFAQIGKKGRIGVERIALSDEDKQARDLLKSQMLKAGLEVHIDQLGNMIGIRRGTKDLPSVAMGSHLDTVYAGGRYDGALGVLAGLEVIQTLNDQNIQTEHPIALVNFTNEEGVRFAPDMMGSHVYAGLLNWTKF